MAVVSDPLDRLRILAPQHFGFLPQHRLELAQKAPFLGEDPAQVLMDLIALNAHCAVVACRSCSSCSRRAAIRSELMVYWPDAMACCTDATRSALTSGMSRMVCAMAASERADCVMCTLSPDAPEEASAPSALTGVLRRIFSIGLLLPVPMDPPSSPLIRFATTVSLRSSTTLSARERQTLGAFHLS